MDVSAAIMAFSSDEKSESKESPTVMSSLGDSVFPGLEAQLEGAASMLRDFTENATPDERFAVLDTLSHAKGLVFMRQLKAGFMWSGTVGTGIMVKRLPSGDWSAPSSIGCAGTGWGFMAGLQSVDTILALFDTRAVDNLASLGSLRIGGELSITAGPLGRTAAVDARVGSRGVAGCFSYSRSHGLFAGVSLDGTVLLRRDDDNAAVYGEGVAVDDILSGKVAAPPMADELLGLIKSATAAGVDTPVAPPVAEPLAPAPAGR